jgi:tRNA pseudouridine32 synthase/23S rRNA pseudouridine746 synthase
VSPQSVLTPERVLHADEAVVVAVKPADLLAVPGKGEAGRDCLSARLQARWPAVEIVHRLDMATSGLMVFALGKAAQRELSRAFAARQVHKRYEAVVHGRLGRPGDEGEIDLPLIADWPNRPKQKVDHALGKPSLTRYRVLAHEPTGTRLALEPVTGRSHQLRVHLLALGHPIVGDTLYRPDDPAGRLHLHACELRFNHPLDDRPLAFTDPAPF